MSTTLADNLASDEYTRVRLFPEPKDYLYLHLIDLRRAIGNVATDRVIRVMDYGCGGSPYRSLFPNAKYERADFVEVPGLDFKVTENSAVAEAPDSSYDLVLSTQVLEHVSDPGNCLRECLRLLKPGGLLVLSTHGTFPEHGVPYDFQRWTADGLRNLVSKSGFENISLFKLTTGIRAVFQLAEDYWQSLRDATRGPSCVLWKVLDRLFISNNARRNSWVDKHFPDCRVVSAPPGETSSFYIGLFLTAQKPVR
jgi:SAM-dependent methyltransferase